MQKIQHHEIKGYLDFIDKLGIDLHETKKNKGSKAVLDSFYDNLTLYRRVQLIEKIQAEIKSYTMNMSEIRELFNTTEKTYHTPSKDAKEIKPLPPPNDVTEKYIAPKKD
jgi:hypothetical protein